MKKFLPFLFCLLIIASCSAKDSSKNAATDNAATVSEETATVQGTLDKNGKIVITETGFQKGSEESNESTESTIREIASYLKTNTSVSMNVVCYTNDDGTPAQCIDLSKKRAQNISEQLKQYGIDEKRIKYEGKGWEPSGSGERIEFEVVH